MIANHHRPTPAPVPAPLAPTTPVVVAPKVMKHELQPDWGMGLIVEDDGKYLVLYFERAGLKKFIKDKAKVLSPVTLSAADMTALKTKANGRSKKPRPEGSAKKKAKAKAVAKARFTTIADQIAAFEKLFAGGFLGEAFVEGERGRSGVEGKDGLKEAAISFAQKALSKEAFDTRTPEELFESARLLLKATNIVFPIEGAIPFASMDPENRTKALAGLKDLLHGGGDYADRLEAFAASVTLKDSKGTLKTVTWPFATVFGALLDPNQHTCVKPTALSLQGLTVGLNVEKSQPVKAEGYRQFFSVVKKTSDQLKAAGQQPRDLMDVYSFIYRTHAEKPVPVAPAA
jgi:hypothetical protein